MARIGTRASNKKVCASLDRSVQEDKHGSKRQARSGILPQPASRIIIVLADSETKASRLLVELLLGGLCGAAIGSVQALAEGLILARRFNDAIFTPELLAEQTQLFWLISRVLRRDEGASFPLILDPYLGPALVDKVP